MGYSQSDKELHGQPVRVSPCSFISRPPWGEELLKI